MHACFHLACLAACSFRVVQRVGLSEIATGVPGGWDWSAVGRGWGWWSARCSATVCGTYSLINDVMM